ncbi:homologous recombination OB-fold protein isoform X1 [Alosa alosa]|uniref:homologous recombination OB-fold protein isoform X1 n=1 Tax=Alosa alosa TaxID=278164 RepID=UPI0020154AE1|nr:homologous recombination OB-fold protein isoform X1 [Alosa alosa]
MVTLLIPFTRMQACKWNGLFSVGEEFDDEDLLQADWTVPTAPATALQPIDVQGTSTSNTSKQAIPATTITIPNESDLGKQATHNVPGQTSVLGLRGFSASKLPSTSGAGTSASISDMRNSIQSTGPTHQNTFTPASGACPLDDFDDWDVDLTDLDENVPHVGQPAPVTSLVPPTAISNWPCEDSISPAKRMRPSACANGLTPPGPSLRGFSIAAHTPEPLGRAPIPRDSFATPRPSPGPFRNPAALPAPPRSPVIPRMASSFPSPVAPRLWRPQTPGQTGSAMGQPAGHVRGGLFQAVSPCPSPTPTPRPLHTPVLTNHLVQLVSASKKTPQRPRTDPSRPKTRRFPGPAGMLPQQLSGKSLDDIVVAVPQTPAHGAVARLRSEVPSSQPPDEEDFNGGAWAAMKAEMGLDEKNPSCFLHSYSVVMVLRKAALKQLNKNKVPNMAVVLKSILHTHADAKAVFKDPTGEMQGTVHRRLLEDRQAELKTGAVLLLKQVGVFSPSHRNHYLNVTPNNLLRIYPPDGSLQPCTLLSQHALGPAEMWGEDSRTVGGPVSQMELRFEDEEDEEQLGQEDSRVQEGLPQAAVHNNGPLLTNEGAWDTDGLDELLGELPVETYSV